MWCTTPPSATCRGQRKRSRRYRTDPDTDFHALASEITGLQRKDAKNVNFAKIYGAGVKKFAEMIGKPLRRSAGDLHAVRPEAAVLIAACRRSPTRSQPAWLYRALRRRPPALGSLGAAGLQQGRRTLLARRGTTAHSRPRTPLVSPEAATGRHPHCAQRPDSRRRCAAYQTLDACSLARGHRAVAADARRT